MKDLIIKNCPKCGVEFQTKTNKKFCSRKCANSRVHSITTKNKISLSLQGKNKHIIKGEYKCKYCNKCFTTNIGCKNHELHCYNNINRIPGSFYNKKHTLETKIKIGINNRMGTKNPISIADMSKAITSKIIKRGNYGCSICGWNEGSLDIHHIIPKSKGGTNLNSNLCLLCPNHHRLVHNNKIKSSELKSIEETIGDGWKHFYFANNGSVTGEATGMTVNHLSTDMQDASA